MSGRAPGGDAALIEKTNRALPKKELPMNDTTTNPVSTSDASIAVVEFVLDTWRVRRQTEEE
jgi:hypothetical protein